MSAGRGGTGRSPGGGDDRGTSAAGTPRFAKALPAAALIAALSLVAVACGTGVFEPAGPDPLVYVVLNQTITVDGQTVQRAFLLDADSVLPPYRGASRFEITRTSDGSTFPWRDRGLEGQSPFVGANRRVAPLERGNFELVSPSESGGAIAALTPTATYRLRIETGGRTVTGSTTLPARFEATVRDSSGRRVLDWPPVAGAAGYRLSFPLDSIPVLRQAEAGELLDVRTETEVPLPDFLPDGLEIHVRALDANLLRALEGEDVQRSGFGLQGGRGVFGAVSRDSVTL